MAYTQENRMITLDTPLGKDELLPTAFRGTEGMSRLFSFEVVAVSHNQAITFEKIVGKSVTLAVRLQDGTERYFTGIVNRFSQAGTSHQQDKEVHFTEYRATVVPWLWLLTLTENSKIFQDKSVPDIVEAVFQKRGFQKGKDYAFRLRGSYDKRVYCVQYRETDFHFVSRLLEEEGIHYFFEHGKGQHTLVVADDAGENKQGRGHDQSFHLHLLSQHRLDLVEGRDLALHLEHAVHHQPRGHHQTVLLELPEVAELLEVVRNAELLSRAARDPEKLVAPRAAGSEDDDVLHGIPPRR